MDTLRMKTKGILTGAALVVAASLAWAGKPAPAPQPAPHKPPAPDENANANQAPKVRPKVEVVFVLDTTGSMTGLIQGAKEKIWSIAKHIASGKPTPDVSIGLVAYRDIGDAYVTKSYG